MTNAEFCYWLQGYFEISDHVTLTPEQITKILATLEQIDEPLGPYTGWLKETLHLIQQLIDQPHFVGYLLQLIKNQLNQVFLHVIDNSYDTEFSSEELQSIHQGKVKPDSL